MSKALHFLQITAKQQYCPFFAVFLIVKTSSQNISKTLLQISLKLHEHRDCYWKKKLPWTILEEQFSVLRYTAASKIGNSVILLLWQLRCRCNPDHNKFSYLSNTTVVATFPKLCLWWRSLCSNLWGIGPEKLYWATLKWPPGNAPLPLKMFPKTNQDFENDLPPLQNGGPTSQVINDSPSLSLWLGWISSHALTVNHHIWSHLGVSCMCLVFQLFASKTAELLAFHQIEVKSSYPKEG